MSPQPLTRLLQRLAGTRSGAHQHGQALVIFVLATTALIGAAALATDASWLFVSQQRMQRAADAAALAGAVYLPGDPATAIATARSEAARNGYAHGTDGIDVQPTPDPGNPRRLIVDIDQPVGTFFARVFCVGEGACLESVDVAVQGRAEYVLPVPMGSPQNYYGVGMLVDAVTTTTTTDVDDDTDWLSASGYTGGGRWRNPNRAYSNNNSYTQGRNEGDWQDWGSFGLYSRIPDASGLVIEGLEVGLTDVAVLGGSAYDCRVDVQTSWNGGSSWSNVLRSTPLSTNRNSDIVVGSADTTADWGGHAWIRNDFSDAAFRVRLTWHEGPATCPTSRRVQLDELEVRVHYRYVQTTTTTTIGETPVVSPEGNVLAPQNFWGAMQSQGAPSIQGDAFMTYYDERTSRRNDDYDPEAYYQYAVEFPAGSSGGEVWLFDPAFCHVDSDMGTGENWNTGGSYGYSNPQPVSAFYDLYDTKSTLYHSADDTMVASSGNAFKHSYFHDAELDRRDPISAPDCSGESWHNGWWKLADGLGGNKTFRVHAYSTDPSSQSDQQNSTALNSFAIFAKASGGTPRVYGLGAMEAYVRLPGGRASEFYLAQIDAEHAGKTMVIKLWDPGDTGNLAANLQILRPTASSYQATRFNYSASRGSHHSNTSSCDGRRGTAVDSVTTNTGGNSLYNGCWLTIEIPLPTDYSAPHPSTDTVTSEGGWWKIRYNMAGGGSDYSTDLTTWEVELRGSPVHLVIP